MRSSVLCAAAALGLLVAGCGATQPTTAPEYQAVADEHLRLGSYSQAAESYRNLLDEHPFSEYSEQAELKIGIAQYKDAACPEATVTLTDFQRRHPTSSYLPLVGYLLGQCAELQMRPSDRDQSASQNAHAYYQALIQQHPTSPYAVLARQRLAHARETLAVHEFDVAEYYERHDNDRAAEIRMLDLVNRFPDTEVAGRALYQLGRLYEREGKLEKAQLAYAAVGYHYPDHQEARQAEARLEDLADAGPLPSGDPLVTLRSETGRTRTIAIAQTPRPMTQAARRGASAPGAGLGLPGGAGPFGRSQNPYGQGRY